MTLRQVASREVYRNPWLRVRQDVVELPDGGTPLELAQAELREETGLTAASWTHLGWLASAYGYAAQGFDVWLAEDLTPGPHDREATEADMQVRRVTAAEVGELVRSGELVDAHAVAAWALLALHDGGA